MGESIGSVAEQVTNISTPPRGDELEITVFGPGYGETIAMHIGSGAWVIVDSCINPAGEPRSLRYLADIGVDARHDVKLVVATHWHDDHIRGMGRLVEACESADFCCSSALCRFEFTSVVGALEGRGLQTRSSGVREIYEVFTHLGTRNRPPQHAMANRRIYFDKACEIWALSPSDTAFQQFLLSVSRQQPEEGERKQRLTTLSPNTSSVVLWVRIDNAIMLLGADMENPGWIEILASSQRPTQKASIFKVPHHGSKNADKPEVWRDMVESDPLAALTPWRRGGSALPRPEDVSRILSHTTRAYSTSKISLMTSSQPRRHSAVGKTLRESGIRLRSLKMSPGAVRFRRAGKEDWRVEMFGSACELAKIAA